MMHNTTVVYLSAKQRILVRVQVHPLFIIVVYFNGRMLVFGTEDEGSIPSTTIISSLEMDSLGVKHRSPKSGSLVRFRLQTFIIIYWRSLVVEYRIVAAEV